MELTKIFLPLKKWWWLIVAATALAGVSSYFSTRSLPPVYQARTTLIVGNAIFDPNPTSNQFALAGQLAQTYANIANREQIRNQTMAALGTDWLPEYNANVLPQTQFVQIAVNDIIPERAQIVANELGNQLVLLSPTSSEPEQTNRQEFVNSQLDTIQQQIIDTQALIEELDQELGNLNSAVQIAETQNQISALDAKLNTLQSNYANLLANTQQGALNTISILEPAGLPERPVSTGQTTTILLAAAVGFALASSAAFLLEFLNKTLETREDIEHELPYPIIGEIPEMGRGQISFDNASNNPRSTLVDALRTVRENLEFFRERKDLKTVMISSADLGEGKSTIALYLALVQSFKNRKVVLIDLDLRIPSIHEFLGLPRFPGLSEYLRGEMEITEITRAVKGDNFRVITSGKTNEFTQELLTAEKLEEIFEAFRDTADLIILDGLPMYVAGASYLASKADGVLLITRAGYTRKDMVKAMKEQITLSGANILGVVVNCVSPKSQSYLYRQDPYYPNDGKLKTSFFSRFRTSSQEDVNKEPAGIKK